MYNACIIEDIRNFVDDYLKHANSISYIPDLDFLFFSFKLLNYYKNMFKTKCEAK